MVKQKEEFAIVFRTEQLLYLDGACEALQEAGIPCEQMEETAGGTWPAMRAAESMNVPALTWAIRVPNQFEERARQLLSSLPFQSL
ncbi:MAG: DUF2007 domain-containing protein [Verrucomicrobia bacterium]|nr:DUF2007 domain-containing protein [Verrucomicrobiota bacterium]